MQKTNNYQNQALPRLKPIVLALGLTCGIAPHVAAAPQAEVSLPTITTFGQREAQIERKNAELQKIVISEEEVERFGDATVGDVLRRLPGMSFTGPAGVTKDIRMRGLDKGYTLFLINGEPVPGAVQERQMQVDRLPADMIERIEIIRNPTAEYGASGIGGTVNIVLKNRAENMTRFRAAWGKNGSMNVGDVIAQWSRRIDNLDVVMALSHTVGAEDVVEDKNTYNSSGTLTKSEHKPKPVKKTETLFTPRLSWRFGEDRLTLDPFISRGTEDKIESTEVRNGAGVLTQSTYATENKTDQIARLSGRYDGKASWGSWYAKFGTQDGTSDKDKNTIQRNGTGVINKRSLEIENIQESQAYAGMGGALPLGAHTLKAGVEYRDNEYEKRKSAAEASNATNPLVPKAPGANDIYGIKEQKSVAYLQDEWRLAQDHWLTPGLRYERTARDATDRNDVTTSSTNSSPNPSVHYRWAMTKETNFRASYAQTLNLPKFDYVNPLVTLATGANSITNPDTGGNANLRPESAKGIELGIERFFWDNRGLIGINFYNRDVASYIQKQTLLEGSRYVERPYNVGDARFWGAEIDWRMPLIRKGPHELTLIGSHAELRGKVRNASTGQYGDIKDLPPRVTNIGLDWRHHPTKLTAGFSVNHSPSFTTDGLNGDGIREIKRRDSMTLLDLYAGKVISPTTELRLIAKNLLSVKKREFTTKYNANGSFNTAEDKTESSKPTIFLTLESRL